MLRLCTPETLGFRPIALNLSDGAVASEAGRTAPPHGGRPFVVVGVQCVHRAVDAAAVDPPVPLSLPFVVSRGWETVVCQLAFVSLVRKTGYMTTIPPLRRPVGDPNGSIQAHRYARSEPEGSRIRDVPSRRPTAASLGT